MKDQILVHRLRSAADLFGGYRADVMREAADRIERLERDLAERSRSVDVRDDYRILDQFPIVRDVIARWIGDPSPKLTGLSIQVMPFDVHPGLFGLELRFGCQRDGVRFASCYRFMPVELVAGRDPEGSVAWRLNALHEMLVREIREGVAKAKA